MKLSTVIKHKVWGYEAWFTTNLPPDFPLLIKYIHTTDDLSVQVHPSDEHAPGGVGKSEMWYVTHAEPEASVFVGFAHDTSPQQLAHALQNGSVCDLLNRMPVKEGDIIFVPAGTVHALGKGISVFEIQQNTDITYRLFDYNRPGPDGLLRELHIDQALTVLNFRRYHPVHSDPHFTVNTLTVESRKSQAGSKEPIYICVEGAGTIQGETIATNEVIYLPHPTGLHIAPSTPQLKLLEVYSQ